MALAGYLSLAFATGYTPATNDSFTLVTAGTRSGSFAGFFYPSNLVTMSLSNAPNAVIARITGITPQPPPPIVLSISIVGTNAVLSWTAVSNSTYEADYNPDLTSSNWNALPGSVTSLSNVASKFDPVTLSNRFYRVRVLP